MPVDIFSRLPSGPTDSVEQFVLQRVLKILNDRGEDAAIIVNMFTARGELDFVVATTTVTLTIEVKGYRLAIEGQINSRCWRVIATGEERRNAYEQIDSASTALKDSLRAMTGTDPGYAHAVVLFAHGIPSGSKLPETDHRVTFAGGDELEKLLSTPVPPETKRGLWSPDLIRQFARKMDLAILTTPSITPVSAPIAPPATTAAATPAAAHAVVNQDHARTLRRPPKPRGSSRIRLRTVILSIAGLAIVGSGLSNWMHQADNERSNKASTRTKPITMHESTREHATDVAAHKLTRVRDRDEDTASLATTGNRRMASQANPPLVTQPVVVTPQPPCPAGIDRLGCIPDAKTLARLRGY